MEQTLMFEPTQEDLYQRAIRQSLEKKIARAIHLLKTYEQMALRASDEGYYVAFSGGKDSIVIAKLCEMAGVKHTLNYSNTTIDPPELVRFIKREHPQTVWHGKNRIPLPMMMKNKSHGPPTRLARWCCEIYKEQGGTGLVKVTGVRAPESVRRKGLWREINNNNNGGEIICPIVYWTDEDVWNFIRQNDMKYCELYDQGYKRLGCIGCPMSGANRGKDFKRWPRYERLWQRGFKAYFEKYSGTLNKKGEPRWIDVRGMTKWEDLWEWWLNEGDKSDEPDCQLWLW